MRTAAGSRDNRLGRLDGIGEILARGVERWLLAREQEQRQAEACVAESAVESLDNPLIQAVVTYGAISTKEAIELTGVSRSTARRRLAELVALKKLALCGKGRGTRYVLPPES